HPRATLFPYPTLFRAAHPRQWPRDCPQSGQLRIGEAARLFRGPTRAVDDAVGEWQRQRDIVGDTVGTQVGDDREAVARGIVDARSEEHTSELQSPDHL